MLLFNILTFYVLKLVFFFFLLFFSFFLITTKRGQNTKNTLCWLRGRGRRTKAGIIEITKQLKADVKLNAKYSQNEIRGGEEERRRCKSHTNTHVFHNLNRIYSPEYFHLVQVDPDILRSCSHWMEFCCFDCYHGHCDGDGDGYAANDCLNLLGLLVISLIE